MSAAGASVFPLKVQRRKDGDYSYCNTTPWVLQGAQQSILRAVLQAPNPPENGGREDEEGGEQEGGRGDPAPTSFRRVYVGAPLAVPFCLLRPPSCPRQAHGTYKAHRRIRGRGGRDESRLYEDPAGSEEIARFARTRAASSRAVFPSMPWAANSGVWSQGLLR